MEFTQKLWQIAQNEYKKGVLDKKEIGREYLKQNLLVPERLASYMAWALKHQEIIIGGSSDEILKDNKMKRVIEENKQEIELNSYEIKTVEQLLEYAEVDTDIWEVSKFVVNTWGSETYPCYQCKAWLQRKTKEIDLKKQIEYFKESAKKHAPKYKKIVHDIKSDNMLEIAIPDFHFGQLSWKEETGGENYDIKIATKLYIDAITYILQNAKIYNPSKIVFIIGSDFFNVNSMMNQTAAGTVQDEDGRWQKTYTYGRELVVKAIDICREVADVDVIVIYGNHDFERSFYLGDSLWCWYNNCNNVTVNNEPLPRKYFKWGKCLIGSTHGDKEVRGSLPMLMATEARHLWKDVKFCEWHTGHKHIKNKKEIKTVDENVTMRERIIPSLCPIDAWHSLKGYNHIREAQGFIWNKEKGNISVINYTY